MCSTLNELRNHSVCGKSELEAAVLLTHSHPVAQEKNYLLFMFLHAYGKKWMQRGRSLKLDNLPHPMETSRTQHWQNLAVEVALEMQFKCLKRATEVTAAGETETATSLLDIAGGADSQEDLVRELEEQVMRPAAADSDAQPGGLALIPVPLAPAPDAALREDDPFAVCKKRRLMPGAKESGTRFNALFASTDECYQASLATVPAPFPGEARGTIRQQILQNLEYARTRYPGWSDNLTRLGAAAVCVYRTRYTDLFMTDYVALLWVIEGERFLRAHNGRCYLYHNHGAFEVWSGVPAESTFSRVKTFLLRLEGMFRLMSPHIARCDGDLLDEIQRLLDEHNSQRTFLEACTDSAIMSAGGSSRRVQRGRRRAAEDQEEEEDGRAAAGAVPGTGGWPSFTADTISKIAAPLQEKLLDERRLMQFVAQWCGTPIHREAGCAYADVCVKYDQAPGEHVRLVPPRPEENIYVRIPHALKVGATDPMLLAAKTRLEKFVRQTFWCNIDFYKCNMAAIALAKRGRNIDRCFIGESPGGTGQSLYSAHLAAVYGHNHAYVDPNLFHNEEEMRKQLEQFAHCFIITCQEAPESGKAFQQDLYKKMMSADDLSARRPYGFMTRMLRVVGWKRYEANRLMTFRNVVERNFNSVKRRGLVWEPMPAFVEGSILESEYPDASEDGIFAKDPALRAFLESGPAIAASLQQQHGFECSHSETQCYQLIDDFAEKGVTENKLREACGLSPRVDKGATNSVDEAIAVVAPADAGRHEPVLDPVEKAHAAAVVFGLDPANNRSKFSKAWWDRNAKPKLSADKKTWEGLLAQNLLIAAEGKCEPDFYVLRIRCKRSLQDVCPLQQPASPSILRECIDASAFWDHLEGNPSRQARCVRGVHVG